VKPAKDNNLLIVTLASHKPNFLELQLKNFTKILGVDFTFLVLNNAKNSGTYNEIEKICSNTGITCIKVRKQLSLSVYRLRSVFKNGDYRDPSLACSYGMNWFWKNILPAYSHFKYILFIDSDMFILNKEKISKLLSDAALVTIEQFRGKNFEFSYPYAGFNIINNEYFSLVKKLNWNPAIINNERLDCGGASTSFYKELKDLNLVKKILLLSLRSISGGSKRQIEYQINGNLNGVAQWDTANHKVKLLTVDNETIFKLNFPNFSSSEIKMLVEQMLYNSIMQVDGFLWPTPIYIDFIFDLDDINVPLVFHYKSGSNYQAWQDENYNKNKTLVLESMLENI
jgi:hypothetical protein